MSLLDHGYYTLPRSSGELMLQSRAADSGRGVVEGFTVGRRGLGWVRWEGHTDLRGGVLEALHELVRFGRGWVEVYPKGGAWVKPPRGQGLNRPATIALHGCRPEPGCALPAFVARLRATRNTRFLAYCPISGTWTFAVEHFTRYGLSSNNDDDDSDDSDEDEGDDDVRGGGGGAVRRTPAFRLPTAARSKGPQAKAAFARGIVRGATPQAPRYVEDEDEVEDELDAEAEVAEEAPVGMEEEEEEDEYPYDQHLEDADDDEDGIGEELDEDGVDIDEESDEGDELRQQQQGRTPPPVLSRLTPVRCDPARVFFAEHSRFLSTD
jgi:hypothetical protein